MLIPATTNALRLGAIRRSPDGAIRRSPDHLSPVNASCDDVNLQHAFASIASTLTIPHRAAAAALTICDDIHLQHAFASIASTLTIPHRVAAAALTISHHAATVAL